MWQTWLACGSVLKSWRTIFCFLVLTLLDIWSRYLTLITTVAVSLAEAFFKCWRLLVRHWWSGWSPGHFPHLPVSVSFNASTDTGDFICNSSIVRQEARICTTELPTEHLARGWLNHHNTIANIGVSVNKWINSHAITTLVHPRRFCKWTEIHCQKFTGIKWSQKWFYESRGGFYAVVEPRVLFSSWLLLVIMNRPTGTSSEYWIIVSHFMFTNECDECALSSSSSSSSVVTMNVCTCFSWVVPAFVSHSVRLK